MKRRNFLGTVGTGLAATRMNPSYLIPSARMSYPKHLLHSLYDESITNIPEHYMNYDPKEMGSAERVWFEKGNEAWVNVFPRPDKKMDIRVYTSENKEDIYTKKPKEFQGVEDCADIRIGRFYSPHLYYRVEYRDGKGNFKSLSTDPIKVKTQNVDMQKGEKIKIVIIGDDHVYADLRHEPTDSEWKKEFLRGDYIAKMMYNIDISPDYVPYFVWKQVTEGYTYAWTCKYIRETRPDLVIDLGDTVGPDSHGVWGKNGQWPDELQPYDNWIDQSIVLWERKRRTISPFSSEIPYYLVPGNHEGFNAWEPFKYLSTIQKDRLLRPPKRSWGSFRPIINDRRFWIGSKDNYYTVDWGANGDNQNPYFQFMALDYFSHVNEHPEKITDWTLGGMQRQMVEDDLIDGREIPWRMMGAHHWNGYPRGPHKNQGAYGRGNIVTPEDYEELKELAAIYDPQLDINPTEVEQAIITELARECNVRLYGIGHDHIFGFRGDRHKNFQKPVGKTSDGKEMAAMCVGSTKYTGGDLPYKIWDNPYWMKVYGDHQHWTENEGYENGPPPFLTPPGVTQLEIDKDGATIRYVCTAPPFCMHSNMPRGTEPGKVLTEYRISA